MAATDSLLFVQAHALRGRHCNALLSGQSNAFNLVHTVLLAYHTIMFGLVRFATVTSNSTRLVVQSCARRHKSTVAAAAATAAYDQSVETFPSIVIGPNKTIVPQGSFAEAQAQVCCFILWQSNHTTFFFHSLTISFLC